MVEKRWGIFKVAEMTFILKVFLCRNCCFIFIKFRKVFCPIKLIQPSSLSIKNWAKQWGFHFSNGLFENVFVSVGLMTPFLQGNCFLLFFLKSSFSFWSILVVLKYSDCRLMHNNERTLLIKLCISSLFAFANR